MTDDRNKDRNLDDTQAFADEDLEADERRERAAPPGRAARAGAAPGRSRAFAIDPSLRIRDRASELFVIGAILVFVGIFLYSLAYGRGGALTPQRTQPPPASVSPAPSGAPSGSPSTSGAPSQSPGSSPAESSVPSLAPSGSPVPAESFAPSPTTS
jgi:hypothetical protein